MMCVWRRRGLNDSFTARSSPFRTSRVGCCWHQPRCRVSSGGRPYFGARWHADGSPLCSRPASLRRSRALFGRWPLPSCTCGRSAASGPDDGAVGGFAGWRYRLVCADGVDWVDEQANGFRHSVGRPAYSGNVARHSRRVLEEHLVSRLLANYVASRSLVAVLGAPHNTGCSACGGGILRDWRHGAQALLPRR